MPRSQSSVRANNTSERYYTASVSFLPPGSGKKANIVFRSSDAVLFYLNSQSLLDVCADAFASVLATAGEKWFEGKGPIVVSIPEPSHNLAVILHFVHKRAFHDGEPTFQVLVDGISAIPKYDIDPLLIVIPSNPCYNRLLVFVPTYPLEVYSLAAQLDLYMLAATASSFLLWRPFIDVSDEMATSMGPVYVRRLLLMHMKLREDLGYLMRQPPYPHLPSEGCDGQRKQEMTRAWEAVTGELLWDPDPNLSEMELKSKFEDLKSHIECEECLDMFELRVKDVVSGWAAMKTRTI